ncbi:TolC family protein [Sinomicrobium kalidii]|uniref:TolC family protein n=1 Tax=Sinomicrobium kalidii TaxID=2900738 RepID=UPI001E48F8A0|nr:TolC family protein [Sinomicrobium kalidii]UGU15449.1 TolC family protein [Sinomicrobium kalidii]
MTYYHKLFTKPEKGGMFLLLLLVYISSFAQNKTIQAYIEEGLNNNIALQNKELNLKEAHYRLEVAKGMFYPTLAFKSDYTYSSGGRAFTFPIGDMLNPVYNSLNELTQSNDFQNIPNASFNLNANDFYNHRLSLTVPLIDKEIFIQKKLRKESISRQEAEVLVYKRKLVRDIKEAYYNIIKADHQIKTLQQADTLLRDNYKNTLSKVKNGTVLKGKALQIHTQINDNSTALEKAQNDFENACAYLNFLTNRPLTRTIRMDTSGFSYTSDNTLFREYSISNRPELQSLQSQIAQAEYDIKINKSAFLPTIHTSLDLGYQNSYFKFEPEDQYLQGMVSLKWDLFTGFRNKNNVRISQVKVEQLQNELSQAEKQYQLDIKNVLRDLESAATKLENTRQNVEDLKKYYREVKARYDQGIVLLIELNDAFQQLIDQQLGHEQAKTDVLFKQAALEQITASYPF